MEIRKEIGSIYPEKVSFQENRVRTARHNEFILFNYLIYNELNKIKNEKKVDFYTLSHQAIIPGLAPRNFGFGAKSLITSDNFEQQAIHFFDSCRHKRLSSEGKVNTTWE